MYTQFYGLREKPFSLSPDPRYLFLADSHREALAHLLYGIEQGEGFIAITGEVGTGKTTLCRTLLQRIEPGTEVAFIFNPQLSPLELLQSICAELGLEAGSGSRRELTERLNRFLLEKKAEGRRVLLIIDEAQNLGAETLEQIRLLSNLETDTSKLVQIILIGQPELDAILESHQLRQLRQRISVRWRLKPLSALETRDYVRHRLRIAAGAPRELFSELALREVHRRSRGVPRVVNLLCDRALLAGYAAGARSIGLGIVTQTDREIRGGGAPQRSVERERPAWLRSAVPVAALVVLGLLAGYAWQALRQPSPAPSTPLAQERAEPPVAPAARPAARAPVAAAPAAPVPTRTAPAAPPAEATPPVAAPPVAVAQTPPVAAAPPPGATPPAVRPAPVAAPAATAPGALVPAPMAAPAPAAAPARVAPAPDRVAAVAPPAVPPVADLATALARTAPATTTAAAFDALLVRWQAPPAGVELLSLDGALAGLGEHGLDALALRGAGVETLRYFDRPALVVLRGSDGGSRVVLLDALDAESARIAGLGGRSAVRVPLAEFEATWTGEAHVVWRDFESLPPLLTPGQRGAPVAWLQHSLGSLGYYDQAPTGEYDPPTTAAVRAFQASRRLRADGAVGPVTKMALYDALGRYAIPHLTTSGERG